MANNNKNTNELAMFEDEPTTTLAGQHHLAEQIQRQARHYSGTTADELSRQSGKLACAEEEIEKLRAQLERTEAYADSIRLQLQDRSSESDRDIDTREFLQISLQRTSRMVEKLEKQLEISQSANTELSFQLGSIEEKHAEEIRMIRFELGEAQETLAQQELFTEQLASDLVDSRGSRDQLRRLLSQAENANKLRIEELERETQRLRGELSHSHEQLQGKSEAINGLLDELNKKSRKLDAIGTIEDTIEDIDEKMSEQIDDRAHLDYRGTQGRDKVSRVLIGSVSGRELRFPLFKDRLTIGRTAQNDIQLKASYVSRRHAVIVADGDATRVIDWGSKNGVYVNSERVTEHFLSNGDAVRIGTAEFRYEERPKRDA